MNWETKCKNPAIIDSLNSYKDLLLKIATAYAGTRLIEQCDLSALGSDFTVAISDDFPEDFTTIRTIGDLQSSIHSGEYGSTALGLGVIQLCTAFEIFFDKVAEIYSVSVSNADAFTATHWVAPGGSILLGNKALKQVRKIHTTMGISSVLNNDEALIKLAAIIEARNCITHTGGIVATSKAKDRLWAYRLPSEVGKPLELRDNILDDFLHYMAIHVVSFANQAP